VLRSSSAPMPSCGNGRYQLPLSLRRSHVVHPNTSTRTLKKQPFWRDDLRVVHGPGGAGPSKFLSVGAKTRFGGWALKKQPLSRSHERDRPYGNVITPTARRAKGLPNAQLGRAGPAAYCI
jgi:hypothetical protein